MSRIYQPENPITSQLDGLRQRAAKLEALTTEQKRLEEALEESQEVLRKIFESVAASLPAADFDSLINEGNQKTKGSNHRPSQE
jgi:hypothetical protein